MKFNCDHCGIETDRPTGHVNRSRKRGDKLYCGRVCSGLGRRDGKTKAQRVEEKRIYDEQYRAKNRAMLKAKKAAYFQRTYDPTKAAIDRKRNMARHVEYCRRPEYRAYKQKYDAQYRARMEYGEFGDAFMVLLDLERELDARASWYERAIQKGTVNKTIKRKREYEQLIGHQS